VRKTPQDILITGLATAAAISLDFAPDKAIDAPSHYIDAPEVAPLIGVVATIDATLFGFALALVGIVFAASHLPVVQEMLAKAHLRREYLLVILEATVGPGLALIASIVALLVGDVFVATSDTALYLLLFVHVFVGVAMYRCVWLLMRLIHRGDDPVEVRMTKGMPRRRG
jgi:hypothetical protein